MRRASVLVAAAIACAACDAGDVATIGRDDPLVAACAPSCGTASACAVDYCTAIPALAAPPALDGVLECGLPLATIDPSHWSGNLPKPDDVAVAYAVAWRPDGLYVYAEVHESQRLPAPDGAGVYCGDAAHVFVDTDGRYAAPPDYDRPGSLQLVAAAPPDDHTIARRGQTYTPAAPSAPASSAPVTWDPARFATFPTASGYVLEAFVTAADLGVPAWSLASAAHVGFDLSISYGGLPSLFDEPSCPKRADFLLRTSAATATTTGYPHDDVRAFCNPALSAPP